MSNPCLRKGIEAHHVTGRIVPVYRLTAGLSQNVLSGAVRQGLDACGDAVPDDLPASVRESCQLAQARYAYENIHFPMSFEALDIARRRLIFEELFIISAAMGLLTKKADREDRPRPPKDADPEEFCSALPFTY